MIESMPQEKSRRAESISLGLVCGIVLLFFGWWTAISVGEWGTAGADYKYNLLVEGFRSGRLTLDKTPPPQLALLKDPYDPEANLVYRMAPYGLHDLSYYKGKLYLYFGVTPAVVLFWPWILLTGHYLLHKYAVALFCSVEFLAAVGLMRAMGRRYFPEAGWALMASCALALGLATGFPILLQRADICEVPISCSVAFQMLALAAIWRALHDPGRMGRWLAAGSLAFGLAVGARPSDLFGAAALLLPVAAAWTGLAPVSADGPTRGRPGRCRALAAAALPLLLCGLALALYNYLRFGNPLEFGEHYQLASDRQDTAQHFSLRYLWFDFRVYFLEPSHWSSYFPFVGQMTPPPLPTGHAVVEDPFGILPNIPAALLALCAPLAVLARPPEGRAALGRWVAAVALVFGNSALIMDLFYGNCSRYEVEFLPLLILLAVIGILSVDRMLAGRSPWRFAVRCGWGALLIVSIGFNLLAGAEHYVVEHYNLANWFVQTNRVPEAIAEFRRVIGLRGDYAEAYDNLGSALLQTGHADEARANFESALRFNPDSYEAHNNLGNALTSLGRQAEAVGQYELALRLKPDSTLLRDNLAYLLVQVGRTADAIAEYREVLRLDPGNAEAHFNLGAILMQSGQYSEGEAERREALRLNPALGRIGQ
jgi:tetratricopeptide (TPR) repeat protein